MPLVHLENVCRTYIRGGFISKREQIDVLKGVNFSIEPGQCLGLLGRSGAGKSTIGRIVLGLESPDSGTLFYQGKPVSHLDKAGFREFRQNVQVVFQNALGSVNPRLTAGQIVEEPLKNFRSLTRSACRNRIGSLLEQVGLSGADADKYPHQFSGGELQRICIARAIALEPKLIVLDEAVSSLDMVIQARIIDLLTDLQNRLNMAYLFISHDIRVLRRMADPICVLHGGRITAKVKSDGDPAAWEQPELRQLFSAVLPSCPSRAA